jgi:phosphoribosylaminoimidazole carboxylase (NCAIR synthetase)
MLAGVQSENDQKIAKVIADDVDVAQMMIDTLFEAFLTMDAQSLEGVSAQLRQAIKLKRELMGYDGKGGGKLGRSQLVRALEILKRAMRRVPAIAAIIDEPQVAAKLQEAVEVEFGASED